MGLKPLSMAEFLSRPGFVPPVTGGRQSRPYANRYDSTGNFSQRGRSGSASKRRRVEEENEDVRAFYNLNARYPPLTLPDRPAADISSIQELLVAAVEIGNEVKSKANDENKSEDWKLLARMQLSVLAVLEAVVEKGVVPISTGQENAQKAIEKNLAEAIANHEKPHDDSEIVKGEKELREALERADKESVLFDADLGPNPIMSKKTLLPALTAGIKARAESTAQEKNKDISEAIRLAGDALDCVSEVEFLGMSSKKFKNRFDENDPKNGTFCTMPVKLTFEDRIDRINFERTIKSQCDLRSVMSLPKNIRTEAKMFGDAIRERYPGDIVIVKPDVKKLALIALRKQHGAPKWTTCWEKYDIPREIMLTGYRTPKGIVLPPLVRVSSPNAKCGEEAADGSGGDSTLTQEEDAMCE
jgi:hypothetical protein